MSSRRMTSWLALWLCVCLVQTACKSKKLPADNPLEELYRLGKVGQIRVVLSEKDQHKLKRNPRKWVKADATVLGTELSRVGVRLKGHRSMRPLGHKPALRLSFDRYASGRTLYGVTELTLNNMVEDPTMMREYLGYRLYRAAGVKAPRVGYTEVYINGDLRGLYAIIESPDESYLRRAFPGELGLLYEGEYGCDLYPGDVEGFDQDFGDEDDRDELGKLAATAQKGIEALVYADRALVNRDSLLSYLAVSAFIADFDGYRHAHNYRIYYQPDGGQWHFLPWGIDRSFKKDLGIFDSYGLAARLCFQDARCRRDYLKRLGEVVDEFERLNFDQGVDVLATITKKYVERDPKKSSSNKQVAAARDKLRAFIASRPATIRKQLACLGNGKPVDADGDGHDCTDCNDEDPTIHPGAREVCDDGIDNDCSGFPDDAPECPCHDLKVGGVLFQLCTASRSWVDAEAACVAKGLHLARIDSLEQTQSLFRATQKLSKERWWIGMHDRDQEGTFVWADGSAVGQTFWGPGEPDNDACNQDCAAIKGGDRGMWHDTHCAQPRPFICR